MVLNQVLAQIDVLIVEETESRSNQGFTVQQTCPQCAGSGEEITNPCNDYNGQGNKQTSKRISVTIPKVWMMEQKLVSR